MTSHDVTYGPDPAAAPPLRWGILAAGGIAAKFATDIPAHSSGSVVAVGSRSKDRAAAFAENHAVPTAHGNYADLVADEQVEAVYVASPHSEHLQHALLAIEAGKPVLVEKSLTRNAAEARQLFDAAADRGVFVMEAMWSRFLPHMVALRDILNSGEIGQVHMVTAEHGQDLDHVGNDHRLKNPELAGGAMLDLAVYPVSFAQSVLGSPDQISALGTKTATGVDESETITLRYGNRALALLSASLKGATRNAATVTGTAGRIEIEPTFYAPTTVTVRPRGGEPRTFTPPVGGGFEYQAAEVARCVAEGRTESAVHSWADTMAVMEMMDEARRQLGVVLPGE
ncbi:Gfo/Idh/MocA family protein [Ruania halotolerans]|uniref:Gfo/Idh/MocA family protein n=1 Tax=Ruania halotolerans TaxID=2897773 RepID=UPI001E5ADA90|nr:Gfo/Idh/MocA family oxidoreductase [Ruania halotolerans]UFU07147.1 Gfo/Idh/MocA family oxidoreductase [Ruania halotolerans]